MVFDVAVFFAKEKWMVAIIFMLASVLGDAIFWRIQISIGHIVLLYVRLTVALRSPPNKRNQARVT